MNTTDALELIRRCYCEGVDITFNNHGGLGISRNRPSPLLLDELTVNRDVVIETLRSHQIGEFDPVIKYPRRYISAPDCIARGACACLGPCANFLRKSPCDNAKGQIAADERKEMLDLAKNFRPSIQGESE